MSSTEVWHSAASLTLIYFLFAVPFFGLSASPEAKTAFNLNWLDQNYIPFVMFLLLTLAFLVPANVLFKRTRFYLLRSIGRIIISPFSEAGFIECFIADQLCSLVCIFSDLTYSLCYNFSGAFIEGDVETCQVFSKNAKWVVACLPYWFRMMQCFRKYRHDQERDHLLNAGKYMTSISVTLVSLTDYDKAWMVLASCATLYTYTWDIKKDWKLLERGPSFPLRERRIAQNKWLYYIAMVLNFFMRLSWIFTVSITSYVRADFLVFLLGGVECTRRAMWNILKIECVQLSNIAYYKAVDLEPFREKGTFGTSPTLEEREQRCLLGGVAGPALRLRRNSVAAPGTSAKPHSVHWLGRPSASVMPSAGDLEPLANRPKEPDLGELTE